MANLEGLNRLHSGISAEILLSPAEGIQHAPVDILSSSAEGTQRVSPVFPRISIEKALNVSHVLLARRTFNMFKDKQTLTFTWVIPRGLWVCSVSFSAD